MNRTIITLITCCLIFNYTFSQKDGDKVLLTINDNEITKAEFERIYKKNNTSTVYDSKSVEDYLELFINYKLKVMEAERLGYDTVESFVKELNGYREHLIKPYLEDNIIRERYLKEAYERTKTEVNVSHILIKFSMNNPPLEDTLEAYERITEIRERIIAGEPFEDAARESSDDPSAKSNGGNLRWFTAFRMVYEFESAAYNMPVGELSMPFRTQYGYHIIKVNDKRPSKGKIKLAHIMIRTNKDSEEEVEKSREKINECYELLENGQEFGEVAKKYSQDQSSARNGGVLRWLNSGVLADSLETILYSMSDSGEYSEPMLLDFGWHIFQFLEKKPVGTYEEVKTDLKKSLNRNPRNKLIEKEQIENIKKEYNFIEYRSNLENLVEILDSSIYAGEWDYTVSDGLIEPIFTLSAKDYLQKDLAEYISKGKYRKHSSFEYIVNSKYDDFVEKKVLALEKSTLEDKYPELRHLLKEYHDGILLFNLTDSTIWSKAIKDTTGLEEFYESKKTNYMWEERVDASIYTLADSSLIDAARKLALMRAREEISKDVLISELCPNDSVVCVEVEDNKFEKNDNELIDKLVWEEFSNEIFNVDDKILLVVINSILEPAPKQLNEARGLITADYQTYLDNEWVKELRNKYNIVVNRKVLKKIK
ncbi:MAG: peptidylprolyl isomerase [Bacteroidales bacterium]|nr:MAG: peptidylprolyl isomerase [Bacteroidales bacterium]